MFANFFKTEHGLLFVASAQWEVLVKAGSKIEATS